MGQLDTLTEDWETWRAKLWQLATKRPELREPLAFFTISSEHLTLEGQTHAIQMIKKLCSDSEYPQSPAYRERRSNKSRKRGDGRKKRSSKHEEIHDEAAE